MYGILILSLTAWSQPGAAKCHRRFLRLPGRPHAVPNRLPGDMGETAGWGSGDEAEEAA
jgi:hypothetical protein